MRIAACRLKYYLHYSFYFTLTILSSEVIEADHIILNAK